MAPEFAQGQLTGNERQDFMMQILKAKGHQGDGVLNPKMAVQLLNLAQKVEDPDAYEPELVRQYRRKQEEKN